MARYKCNIVISFCFILVLVVEIHGTRYIGKSRAAKLSYVKLQSLLCDQSAIKMTS